VKSRFIDNLLPIGTIGLAKTQAKKPSSAEPLLVDAKGQCISGVIRKNPILVFLFSNVYPHRANAQIIRWLDTKLETL